MAGTAEEGGAAEGPRHVTRRASEVNEKELLEGEGVGWPDGVGDGRPLAVPMSLDYFQGFLVQAGVPGVLLEAKARGYEKWFDKTLEPQWNFQGLNGVLAQAERQFRVARGTRLRWHVAEERMVAVLRKHFDARGLHAIEVVYTQPVP
jgi:hypothetical protein